MSPMDHLEALQQFVLDSGAFRAGVVDVDGIPFEPEFRKLCEANSCGMYGRSWMCPPDIGPVDRLINRVKQFRQALVFQTADALEDSYDFEGMMAAGARMNQLIASLRRKLKELGLESCLLLGAGGCRVCQHCAKIDGQPCRNPEEAISSLEAHGINVSVLAPMAGMKYINGPDTVTYFGAVFLGTR